MKKIRDEQEFKRNPQAVILSRKPERKKCEMLDSKIKLSIIITPIAKGHRYEYYFYADGGKHIKFLGNAEKMDYYSARRACVEYAQNPNPKKVKDKPITLRDVFAVLCENRNWSAATLKKKQHIFRTKIEGMGLADISVTKITSDDIDKVAQKIHKQKHYAAFNDFFKLVNTMTSYLLAKEIIEKPLYKKSIREQYVFEESDGYGYIKYQSDLKKLIEHIMSLKSRSVRNALTLGLVTALRHANLREMTRQHVVFNEEEEARGWEIRVPKHEMKVKKNGDFTLAIPAELAEWLLKIAETQPDEKYLFPNAEHSVYCEATFRKALRSYKPDSPGNEKNFTPHSFRRTMTTLTRNKRVLNNIQYDDISRVLSHKKEGDNQKNYDMSDDIETKRMVLSWWLNYLKQNGLELKL